METTICYLAHDKLFNAVKPFSADFSVDHIEGAQATNLTADEREVIIHPIISFEDFKLDIHGFCILRSHNSLVPEEILGNKEGVQQAYWREIQELLLVNFPEYRRVECHDLTVYQTPYSTVACTDWSGQDESVGLSESR